MTRTLDPAILARSLMRVAGLLFIACVAMTACGGGGGGQSAPPAVVQTAPQINSQPQSQKLTVGATASFSVTATGSAPLAYQWSKNGALVPGATDAAYTTPALVLADNTATFMVSVSNPAGSIQSTPALLTVTAPLIAPTISTQPQNQAVVAGSTATFAVVAAGSAPLTYQWSKNGALIAGATAGTYTTPATAQSDNSAAFTVLISNSAGSVQSGAAILTVNAPTLAPSITSQPQNQSVTVGSKATFSATAAGSAPLRYQWSKNGSAIAGATAASYTTAPAATTDNQAAFALTVTNAVGTAVSNAATLTVTTPISITDVVTYHNDNMRTGQNLSEQTLAPANVKQASFGLLQKLKVDGKVDAQPLALGNYVVGGSPHNVVYLATENDSIYAYDADSGALLWQVSTLLAGETPSDPPGNCNQVLPMIGVTATPVIDRAAGKIFLIAMSKDGAGRHHQRLHALDLATGAESAHSPVNIVASVTATGAPDTVNGQIVFDPLLYKERSALLLSQGILYTSWASHCDGPNYTGWILAYDENTLAQNAVFNDEPSANDNGGQGKAAFWNSNSGPSADAGGNIYAMSGNGIFDIMLTMTGFPSGNDYGNSILKLAPPSLNTLPVLDYFTMFNTTSESSADLDLGSGGLMLLPDQTDASGMVRHLAVGAGKDQIIYAVDRDNMGKFNTASNNNAYQAIDAFPPYADAAKAKCGSLPTDSGVFGAPVYYNGNIYYGASGDLIRRYQLVKAQLKADLQTASPFCFPGAALSVSANGASNGILWAVENSLSNGILHAYDAGNLSELYNSSQAGSLDQFGPGSKMTPPTIANGKVFVATQAVAVGQYYVAVFGLR